FSFASSHHNESPKTAGETFSQEILQSHHGESISNPPGPMAKYPKQGLPLSWHFLSNSLTFAPSQARLSSLSFLNRLILFRSSQWQDIGLSTRLGTEYSYGLRYFFLCSSSIHFVLCCFSLRHLSAMPPQKSSLNPARLGRWLTPVEPPGTAWQGEKVNTLIDWQGDFLGQANFQDRPRLPKLKASSKIYSR
ncbi:hypothetical protein AVEN_195485-1, partial [Araneus ventricosus]